MKVLSRIFSVHLSPLLVSLGVGALLMALVAFGSAGVMLPLLLAALATASLAAMVALRHAAAEKQAVRVTAGRRRR